MTLKELLESSPEAKSEFDAKVEEAVKAGCAALQTSLEPVALIAASEKYPATVRNMAVEAIAGKKSRESLDAVVAVAEMEAEKKNSEAAKNAQDKNTTPSQIVEGKSTDGKVRTTADYQAMVALHKKEAK